MNRIPESDWKEFRKLREVARERLCERILAEVCDLAAAPRKSYHERYLAVFQAIQERDKDIALVFDDARRSTAVLQLRTMVSMGIVDQTELEPFSEQTQAAALHSFDG